MIIFVFVILVAKFSLVSFSSSAKWICHFNLLGLDKEGNIDQAYKWRKLENSLAKRWAFCVKKLRWGDGASSELGNPVYETTKREASSRKDFVWNNFFFFVIFFICTIVFFCHYMRVSAQCQVTTVDFFLSTILLFIIPNCCCYWEVVKKKNSKCKKKYLWL